MNKIIVPGTLFILGVGAGLIIQSKDWVSFLTSYIPALATLVAAYYGAKFAFEFQSKKEINDIRQRNIISANSAIFALMRMANNLYVYQRDIIEPQRKNNVRFLAMYPTQFIEKDGIKINLESIYFLLQTDYRNLLGEIMVEEGRFRCAADAINLRSNCHIQEVQPLLERAGFEQGGQYTLQQIESMLGERVYNTIQQSTDQVVEHVDESIVSIHTVADKLTAACKILYPEETIIRFTLPST